MIIEDGCMLLMHNTRDPYLYTVGGGVMIGETSEEAVVREVLEETGAKYAVDRLVMVCEDMWSDDDGTPGHQLDFVYLMASKGTREGIRESTFNGTVTEYPVWVPLDAISTSDICPKHICDMDWDDPDGLPSMTVRHTCHPTR